jgi:hypothetical protein
MKVSTGIRVKIANPQRVAYSLLICVAVNGCRGVEERGMLTTCKVCAVARRNEEGTADVLSERKRAPVPNPTRTPVDLPESPWGTRGLLPITDPK